MNENLNYLSDEELERLMNQVEQEELVAAPPDLMERILGAEQAAQKKEFYAYCFRVITSMAAAIALVFLLPELTERMNLNGMPSQGHSDKSMIMQEKSGSENAVPSRDEVLEGNTAPSKEKVTAGKASPSKAEVVAEKLIPSKAEIVEAQTVPSKEDVLNNTGFVEKIINSTGWFNKE